MNIDSPEYASKIVINGGTRLESICNGLGEHNIKKVITTCRSNEKEDK